MKRVQVLTIAVAVSAVVLAGCTYPNGDPNNTGTGALIGAGSGAALGAVLGGRNAGAGALIGGAFGALTGALIGNSIDREQADELHEEAPVTYVHVQQNQPLTVPDVEALVRAKVSDDVIIAQIQNSHTIYHLSPQDIIDMHSAGVSDKVVNFMIFTVNAPPPPPPTTVVNSDEPPPPADETVAVAPGPDYVWIGGEWQWNGAGWVWGGGRWGESALARRDVGARVLVSRTVWRLAALTWTLEVSYSAAFLLQVNGWITEVDMNSVWQNEAERLISRVYGLGSHTHRRLLPSAQLA